MLKRLVGRSGSKVVVQKKERRLLLVLLVGLLVAGGVYVYGGKKESGKVASSSEVNSVPVEEMTTERIKVHVKGEVNQPGVYELPADSRMIDAIQAAGGAKAGVDLDQLNLASVLTDGGEVVVATEGVQEKGAGNAGVATADGKVNLNTATVEELDKLPGIGSTRANAIVQYRKEQGRFLQVDDLKNVPGFGVKLVDQVRDKVKVQ
ncbi:MAG: ComEA family DNA-binding protein [Tumebacillaceae bacterium]